MSAAHQFPQTLVPGGEQAAAALYLVPVAGPTRPAVELDPRRGQAGLVLGRHESCDLHLTGAEQVSRKHARFQYRPAGSGSFSGEFGGWAISDAGSRWGTFVNGRRLSEGEEMPLRLGDQIRITPWTFLLANSPMPRGLRIEAQPEAATLVRNVRVADAVPLQQERLHLLLSSAGALQEAKDEKELASRLVRLAQDGTNLANGAVLKPLDTGGRFEVLASTLSDSNGGSSGGFTFSRSLLDAARTGEVAEVRADDSVAPTSQSIVQMQITRALCVPIILGETPHLFLYLDQRGETVLQQHATDQEAAVAFCIALSKIASLALSSQKRLEMERRTADYEAEIRTAGGVQQLLMPGRDASMGGFLIVGESRAGRGVGGDFWDVIELDRDKVAVAVGDVSGKGIAASVLMTETHGFLHALLRDPKDLEDVARRLNAHIHPRRTANRFITLWLGIFDKSTARLTYVDAGHGLGILAGRNGECQELSGGGGLPIGVTADSEYTAETVPFGEGDCVLIVSDGIVEQPSATMTHEDRDEFGVARTKEVLAKGLATPDPIAKIFSAVVDHAGTDRLADDATAVLVKG